MDAYRAFAGPSGSVSSSPNFIDPSPLSSRAHSPVHSAPLPGPSMSGSRMSAHENGEASGSGTVTPSGSGSRSASLSRSTSDSGGGGGLDAGAGAGAGPVKRARGRPSKQNGKGEDGTKKRSRKKVAKACLACQKSHLTCDDQRPCSRCVKKGQGDKCVEGVRKKAKYLLEGEARLASASRQDPAHPHHTHPPSPGAPATAHPQLLPVYQAPNGPISNTNFNIFAPKPADDVWLSAPIDGGTAANLAQGGGAEMDPRLWGFPAMSQMSDGMDQTALLSGGYANGSVSGTSLPTTTTSGTGATAASSEYQMLDAMFGSMDPGFPLSATDGSPLDFLEPGSMSTLQNSASTGGYNLISPSWPVQQPPLQGAMTAPPGQQTFDYGLKSGKMFGLPGQQSNGTASNPTTPPAVYPWTGMQNQTTDRKHMPSDSIRGGPPGLKPGSGAGHATLVAGMGSVGGGGVPSDIYTSVVKSFDYTEGYHFLMEYLTKNFGQQDILRVVRALASYRPSLIALQMHMSEDDEIFLERSFQRTMLELEKLISYSATPTAVWRRTGEVCYANPEFCLLVGREGPEMIRNKTYVYQLMGKGSVVEYWENFSVHAFENTTQNYFAPTTLLTRGAKSEQTNDGQPSGEGTPVGCSSCFTIRRDVFDLPSVIIGQFLPAPPA